MPLDRVESPAFQKPTMPDAPLTELVAQLRDLAADPAEGVADADLLRRYVQDRDAVAFEALVWRHARLVMGVCRRVLRHHHDAEDAFQATFLLLARKAARLRRGNSLSAWLHTAAVRVALHARKRRGPVMSSELFDQISSDVPAEIREAGAFVDEEIRGLPSRLRTTFILCELEGRTHVDAARELGCPKGTIHSRMAAAKRRLRAALTRRGLTLASVAALVAAVPELAYSEAARRATVLGLCRPADISSTVAELVATTGGSRWIVCVAAALALAAAGVIGAMSGMARTGDPPKSSSTPKEPPKVTDNEKPPSLKYYVGTKPAWKWTTVGLPPGEELDDVSQAIKLLNPRFEQAISARVQAGRPLIPSAVPRANGSLVIYANEKGIGAFGIRDDESAEPRVKRGEFYWNLDLERAFIRLGKDMFSRPSLEFFFQRQKSQEQTAEVLFNRTLSTSFELSDKYVFTVDEIGFLPTAEWASERRGGFEPVFGNLNLIVRWNGVRAAELANGKLSVLLEGRDPFTGKTRDGPIGATFFLGPPVTDGDYLYAVHQPDRSLRLTSIRWKPLLEPGGRAKDPKDRGAALVRWDAELAIAPRPLIEDVHRRIHAIHLLRAADLIVCPTHLGRLVAVEAKTAKVKWTHEYAPLDANRFPTFAPEWIVVPPVVADDKYIYAPADFPELLCLNVADGKKVWSAKKGDGLYPAVVGDQVLVIGEKTVRSLRLKDGTEQWKLDLPGLPCGRGAALGETYLVPVSEPKTWRGMIAVVDLKAGKITEVLKPEKDVPFGNLVVHQDFLISQTLTEIAVFPIKKKE